MYGKLFARYNIQRDDELQNESQTPIFEKEFVAF